ncbi:uncharacterized protein LOC109709617 [Ananas comosus]|uniref:Uncharacterized protein LOC109709617 n=1 Tax=Ananas comosus TaxID=4615 RepID=A0A6P5EVI6_ANACO|nr:uncharacterized protein LOC109709617 [Ananas comosus]
MKDLEFQVGMRFQSFNELKEAIRQYSINNRFKIKFAKNDKRRVRAVCKEGCDWFIYATVMQSEPTVQVKSYQPKHQCSKDFVNKQVTSTWLAKHYLERIKYDPSWKLHAFQDVIKSELCVNVSIAKCFRAKRRALKIIEVIDTEQYDKLSDYCAEIRKTNPGSRLMLNLSNLIFQRMFICLDACKKGFQAGCRPIISVDGCFLKGKYHGRLLVAVGIDANDCIFPIAYAIVEVESTDTWSWFFQLLAEELNIWNSYTWTFMSDRQKGLIQSVETLFPNADHRFCVRRRPTPKTVSKEELAQPAHEAQSAQQPSICTPSISRWMPNINLV